MKHYLHGLTVFVGKLDRRQIRLVMMLITLPLVILRVGAPEGPGGWGGG